MDTYLAGKDDDLLDDSSSLVLKEVLNDVATNGTCPSDGKDRVSRHELTVSTVCVIFSTQMLRLLYLSFFRGKYYLSHIVILRKLLSELARARAASGRSM
jgi:hypothetical protein